MSYETINLTIYGKKSIFSPDEMVIKELINKHLSSAARITATLDKNDVDVIINKLNTEITLENARPEKIKKFFDNDLIYNGIKSIDFQFKSNDKGQINFKLFPIFGEEIDDDFHDTRLDDFETLGYLSHHDGTCESIDERFFELGENIIRILPINQTNDNCLIRFESYDKKTDIMNPPQFYKRINDLKNEYCNNPDFGK